MTKEVLQQALEALTYCEALSQSVQSQKMQAINAIKQALAQPEEREWVGLTDDEIAKIRFQTEINWKWAAPAHEFLPVFVKTIEQSLKEKNT
jgi:hypothetical protein